jgi:hypothetical protein
MATSTMIQVLDAGRGVDVSHRREEETFVAAAAITLGHFVCLDFGQTADADKALYVRPSATGATTTKCCVGVALETVSAGERVRVCVAGICEGLCAAHTAGDPLVITATSGQADTQAGAGPLQVVAFSVDGTTGVGTVCVVKQF